MIDSRVSIHPIFPMWAIIIAGIFLLAFLIWKEVNRKSKFLRWRILASIILLLSIAGLVLQPSLQRDVSSHGVVLLTPHYKMEIADSLHKTNDQLTYLRTSDAMSAIVHFIYGTPRHTYVFGRKEGLGTVTDTSEAVCCDSRAG